MSREVDTPNGPAATASGLKWPLELVRSFPPASLPKRAAAVDSAAEPWPLELRNRRPCAVAVLFVPSPAMWTSSVVEPAHIVLTRRSVTVRSHRGQIGFPGGRRAPEDTTAADTALRELEEELGVARDRIAVVGRLPTATAIDGSPVVPILTVSSVSLTEMQPAEAEVAAVLSEPWTAFSAQRDQMFRFNLFGHWRRSHLFERATDDEAPLRVWGLTAEILASAAFEA